MQTQRKNAPFPWSGICSACGGSSQISVHMSGDCRMRPSRKTVVLVGDVDAPVGKLSFDEPTRTEVCYRCFTRWRRNKSFICKQARLTANDVQRVQKCVKNGLTVAEIARAAQLPYTTIYRLVKLRMNLGQVQVGRKYTRRIRN